MGHERRRPGRYVCLCAAGLTALVIAACVPFVRQGTPSASCPPGPGFPHLQRLQQFMDAGDFEGALKVGQEVLDRDPDAATSDAALFDLALISVHYGNPKKDYRRALVQFSRLVKEHPRSPLAEEARIWIGILEGIERAKQIDIEIEEKKKEIAK
jgi:hypothetical protein